MSLRASVCHLSFPPRKMRGESRLSPYKFCVKNYLLKINVRAFYSGFPPEFTPLPNGAGMTKKTKARDDNNKYDIQAKAK